MNSIIYDVLLKECPLNLKNILQKVRFILDSPINLLFRFPMFKDVSFTERDLKQYWIKIRLAISGHCAIAELYLSLFTV
jgi:hypothetical protein